MPTMKLPCKLNNDDRLVISADQTQVITALEAVEATKKEANRGFNGTIKGHRKQIHELNEALRKGEIEREVDVEERADYVNGVVETFRLDTDPPVVVKVRRIDPDERQVKLGLPTPGEQRQETAETADEQQEASTPEEAEALRAERIAKEHAERAREERLGAWLAMVRGKLEVTEIVGADAENLFKAAVSGLFGESTAIETTGADPDYAIANLLAVVTDMWRQDYEKRERARHERILEKVGAVWAGVVTSAVSVGNGGDAPDYVVAKLDLGATVMEAEGADEGDARRALRAKLIAKFEAEEDEIARLAAEQVADAKKDGPRALLKAPKGHKKPKRPTITTEDAAGNVTDVTSEVLGPEGNEAKADGDDSLAF